MQRLFLRGLVLLGLVGLSANAAQAAMISFSANLAPESAGATGTGSVLVTVDTVANTLALNTTFSGLSGTTTVAHIHCCVDPPPAIPNTVGVAVTPGTLPGFPVGVQAGSYNISPLLDLTSSATYTASFVTNFGGGTIPGAQAALLAAMQNRRAYFNIHTSTFGGGEIRGFLAPVPEPATLVLLGSGLVGLAARRRRAARRR